MVYDPPIGAEVGPDTVLTIDLDYRIADFSAGQFKLTPLFITHGNRSRSFDVDGVDPAVSLQSASGRVRLCVPLALLYAEEAESVSWPLQVLLILLKSEGTTGSSRSVAHTKPTKLNTTNIPQVALDRQARAPPPEYDDALDYTFGHFQRYAALYKSCLTRFKSMQPRLTPAYRTWEARHKADIYLVSELKLESLKDQNKGRTDYAMNLIDHMAEAQLRGFEELGADDLRGNCEEIILQADPQDDHTSGLLGRYLDVLRTWKASK